MSSAEDRSLSLRMSMSELRVALPYLSLGLPRRVAGFKSKEYLKREQISAQTYMITNVLILKYFVNELIFWY